MSRFVLSCLLLAVLLTAPPVSANVHYPFFDETAIFTPQEDATIILEATQAYGAPPDWWAEPAPMTVCSEDQFLDLHYTIQWGMFCACALGEEGNEYVECWEAQSDRLYCMDLHFSAVPLFSYDRFEEFSYTCLDQSCSPDCMDIEIVEEDDPMVDFYDDFHLPPRCEAPDYVCPEDMTCYRLWWANVPLCLSDSMPETAIDRFAAATLAGDGLWDPCLYCRPPQNCVIDDDFPPNVSCDGMHYRDNQPPIDTDGEAGPLPPDGDHDTERESDAVTDGDIETADTESETDREAEKGEQSEPDADGDVETEPDSIDADKGENDEQFETLSHGTDGDAELSPSPIQTSETDDCNHTGGGSTLVLSGLFILMGLLRCSSYRPRVSSS